MHCLWSIVLHRWQAGPAPWPGRTENKPSHSKAPTYRQGSRGDTRLRTPACRLSTRTLVPELKPCVEVSLIISGWYLSTSHTDPGSYPTRELMFHIHTASLGCQGSVRQGLCPRLPQHAIHPTPTVLPVGGGPTGGHRDLFFSFFFKIVICHNWLVTSWAHYSFPFSCHFPFYFAFCFCVSFCLYWLCSSVPVWCHWAHVPVLLSWSSVVVKAHCSLKLFLFTLCLSKSVVSSYICSGAFPKPGHKTSDVNTHTQKTLHFK